jgi:hypothetical protein
MVERRSMGAAMALSSDKLAFIQGQEVKPEPRREAITKEAEEGTNAEAETEAKASPQVVQKVHRTRKPRTPEIELETETEVSDLAVYEGFPPLLVSLTTRLSPPTAEALRRASLELRLQRRKPHTQQEIVEAAVRHWLKTNGFLRAA